MKVELFSRIKMLRPAAAAALAVMLVAFAPPPKAEDALTLRLDRSARTLEVQLDGRTTRTFEVAVGAPEHETPTGTFHIARLIWNPRWVPPDSKWAEDATRKSPGDPDNPMQGVKLYFREPAYYIHGTNDPESIGEAASHGCVRMKPEEAEELARLVMEHGGAHRSDDWYAHMKSSNDRTEVRIPDPVQLSIVP